LDFAWLQLEEDFVKANPEWVKELEIMVTTRVKAEIQALSSFGFQYLSQQYLPLKLQVRLQLRSRDGTGQWLRQALRCKERPCPAVRHALAS